MCIRDSLVVLLVSMAIVVLVVRCVASSRVLNARQRRKVQRDQRMASVRRSRRRRF